MTILTPDRANSTPYRLFARLAYFIVCSIASIGIQAQSVVFNSPGTTTWTVPANVYNISVEAWGAGGGGSKGYSNLKGTGGGGGAYASGTLAVTPGSVVTITVGNGGSGATVAGNGSDGGASTVTFASNTLTAGGGGGGRSDNVPSGTGGTGGMGSFMGAWTGTLSYCGGYGTNLVAPTASTPGGGGGGAAGQSANGKNAGNATSNCTNGGGGPSGGGATGSGGAGGDGGTANTNGVDGSTRGGGGGGNAGTGFGGRGANGYVAIFYALSFPVELEQFVAKPKNCATQLEWITASEVGFSHFEIERSLNGRDFTKIGEQPGQSSAHGASYDLLDNESFNQVYYRLKMVDLDGSYVYSSIIENASYCDELPINLFPNPVRLGQYLNIFIPADKNQYGYLIGMVLTPTGALVQSFDIKEGDNPLMLEGLPPATYWLKIMGRAGLPEYHKLVVLD